MENSESRESPATVAEKQLFALFGLMKESESRETVAASRLIALFEQMEASKPPAPWDQHLHSALRELMKQLESLENVAGSPSIALFNLAAKLRGRDDEEAERMRWKLARDLLPFVDQVIALKKRFNFMRMEEKKIVAWIERWNKNKGTWETEIDLWNRERIALEDIGKLLNAEAESARMQLATAEREREFAEREREFEEAYTYKTDTDSCEDEEAFMKDIDYDYYFSDEGHCPQESWKLDEVFQPVECAQAQADIALKQLDEERA